MYGSVNNNNISEKSAKNSKCQKYLIYVLVFGLIILVSLGFGIAILSIIILRQFTVTLENYNQIAEMTHSLIIKGDVISSNIISELPHIDKIINSLTKIAEWVCKNYPDINC